MRLAIIGNSAAALSALERFRVHDRSSRVTVVTSEGRAAYSRVLLPYYLRGKLSYDGLFIRGPEYYRRMNADVLSDARVDGVDVATRHLELADGRRIGFDRLLVATGSTPARPPIPGLDGPSVCHLWTLEDALRLDRLLHDKVHVLVLGSGFIALQAAWAARHRGLDVTVVELQGRIMPTALDPLAAGLLHRRMVEHGVTVHTGTRVDAVERTAPGAMHVVADGLDPFTVDVIVVATGVRPNDAVLPDALEPARPGIPVNAAMETSVAGVFAAGDVARGPTASGGSSEILPLWPTAVEQGKVAGANLAGAGALHDGSLSMNVTEMFGLTVATVGRFLETGADDTVVDEDLEGLSYLKLVRRAGVPVGAVAVGASEAAVALGRLRPYVRHRRPLDDVRGVVAGDSTARAIVAGGARQPGRFSRFRETRVAPGRR